jgi:DNA-binding response OmpR family regulator
MSASSQKVLGIGVTCLRLRIVSQATNARDGMAQFSQFKPDITLLDLRLPDVDGLNVLTKLCAQVRDPKIVIPYDLGSRC